MQLTASCVSLFYGTLHFYYVYSYDGPEEESESSDMHEMDFRFAVQRST